jgi:hypothetical protein
MVVFPCFLCYESQGIFHQITKKGNGTKMVIPILPVMVLQNLPLPQPIVVEFLNFLTILPTPPTGTPAQLAAGAITFFTTWISRLGGLVAFVGAVKFALSIKSEDAREQVLAALTMVSGFMIVSAVTNLNIFQFGAAGADAEFLAILTFIGRWIGRIGALTIMLGSIMFGFAIKDNNAVTKVAALKTIAAGALTASIAVLLPQFI